MPPSETLPPPTSTAPDLIWVEPVIPPGVSEDTRFQIMTSARQHFERRQDSRLQNAALAAMNDKALQAMDGLKVELKADIKVVSDDLKNKPGKLEVRSVIAIAAAVFVVMLLSFLQSKGVDTAAVTTQTTQLLGSQSSAPAAMPDPTPTHPEPTP